MGFPNENANNLGYLYCISNIIYPKLYLENILYIFPQGESNNNYSDKESNTFKHHLQITRIITLLKSDLDSSQQNVPLFKTSTGKCSFTYRAAGL